MRTFAAAGHAAGPRRAQHPAPPVGGAHVLRVPDARGTAARRIRDADVRAPKTKKRLPTTLDADQMGRLLTFRADDTLSARDKAIMELFYSSGLRLVGTRRPRTCPRSISRTAPCGCSARAARPGSCPSAVSPSARCAHGSLSGSHVAAARRSRRDPASRCSSAAAGGAECPRGAAAGRRLGAPAGPRGASCIRTCSGTPSRPICSSPAATCAAYRNCSATPTSAPPRSTPIWISSIWPRSTTRPHPRARRRCVIRESGRPSRHQSA